MLSIFAEKKRLDYACRRGTRELEILVRAFLENDYDQASTEQKSIFRWLISMEDDQLWDWINLRGNDVATTENKKQKVKQAIEEYVVTRTRSPKP